ncbi:MAG: 4Fe-4S dicluster domain-containing protein [Anaerolineales bacterium]|nr:4Fe-4S dicluster domain-containing protein [Anaerolineales bacterium]
MEGFSQIILRVLGLGVIAAWFGFAWTSAREQERGAALKALGMGTLSGLLLLIAAQAAPALRFLILGCVALAALAFAGVLLFPGSFSPASDNNRTTRFDERDIVFARHDLQPSTPEYDAFYTRHPEWKAVDDHTRSLPGLLTLKSRQADALTFAAAEAGFFLTEALKTGVDGPVAAKEHPLPAEAVSAYLKALARYFGEHSVGICRLQPLHVYSHAGRGTDPIGDPIPLKHTFALAFTVRMDYDMMGTAPEAPVIMESARQYARAGQIAVQLAAFCRELGYPARAHIDANYQVIAPLVARDAGLGEIGRMGLLMTPDLGPRVRIGVVTTTLPLNPDPRLDAQWMIDFCKICKKCAKNCPSHSIPSGDQEAVDGTLRWKLNSETCFAYWNVEGTDCGICMKVCPFSHPDTGLHMPVRWLLRRSPRLHWPALMLDDFFYGCKPARRPAPDWMQVGERSKQPPFNQES